MTRSLNLTWRTFLLTAALVGLAIWFAQAAGVLCITPIQGLIGGTVFSLVLSQSIAAVRGSAWGGLLKAVLENEQAGQFSPIFPADSNVPEVRQVSEALNGAARYIAASHVDLNRAYLQFVETMAQALDARDPYTAGHSLRVADYSYALAKGMGLSEEDAATIRIAAQLHDIGKIGIPDAVLQKPGPLTPDEYGLIKLHPQIGRKILEKVGRFERLLTVVELHHENHDGSGYPYGLSGEEIPIDARIVHVADSFDAMLTTRSYRSALSPRAVIQQIEQNAGTQFDPEAARVFLKLLSEGQIDTGGLKIAPQREVRRSFRDKVAV